MNNKKLKSLNLIIKYKITIYNIINKKKKIKKI